MTHFPYSWFDGSSLIIAHRGASHDAPENTMAAFEAALTAGADGVELDVHLTADGIPVVIHNGSVDATTDGRGMVNDLTLAEIRRLDAGVHFGSDGAFRDERIPTLEEVLSTYGDRLLVNIELKGQARPQAAARLETTVAELVRRLALQERVWVSSFKPYSLSKMRQVAPAIPCGLLYGPHSLGAAWLAPITPFEALHPEAHLVWPRFVRLAHRFGKRVVVWTVDDVDRAFELTNAGVDAIITNNPRALIAARA
jgi:glycerophosphoryl diester phosphodiesterase